MLERNYQWLTVFIISGIQALKLYPYYYFPCNIKVDMIVISKHVSKIIPIGIEVC